MSTCNICCDKFNNSRNTEVKCIHCEFSACRTCCQTYIVDQTKAKCMNNDCIPEWSRKFLVQKFTKTFVNNDWKKVREKVLYDGEKALLPATQEIVEQRKHRLQMLAEVKEVDRQILALTNRRIDLVASANRGATRSYGQQQERRHFIRACPQEECRGFLSQQWKCGTCATWTCPECHEVKGDFQDSPHTCDPNNVETAKLLAQDTKSCPKCATGIFKIEGCDQMWCTQCHTAFSWRTGRIETHIHNPHFYEWQRRNNNGVAPRNIGDIPCGGIAVELDYRLPQIINQALRRKLFEPFDENGGRDSDGTSILVRRVERVIQSALHLREVQLPIYLVDHVENNLELRVAYLMNEINEEDFKVRAQRANKQHSKKREMGDVIRLYTQTITDIVVRLNEYVQGKEDLVAQERDKTLPVRARTQAERNAIRQRANDILNESEVILVYANECLVDIANTYGSKVKAIRIYDASESIYHGAREVLYTVV